MLTYRKYLRLDDLLSLQSPLGPEPVDAERLFIVTHQAHELWFGILLDCLERARDHLEASRISEATRPLGRAIAAQNLLVNHLDVLETLTASEFARFRGDLGEASGAQSAQYHELAFLVGAKEPCLAEADWLTKDERGRLAERLAEPSLWDAFEAALRRIRPPRDTPDWIVATLSDLAYAPADPTGLWAVAELLRAYDRAAAVWRERHFQLVAGRIGTLPGSGGSSGAAYLRSLVHRYYFPLLWQLTDPAESRGETATALDGPPLPASDPHSFHLFDINRRN